jgi:hypothetical protein
VTVPVGTPATDETVAVSVTGTPKVVVLIFAVSAVVVSAGVIVSAVEDDVDAAFTASPPYVAEIVYAPTGKLMLACAAPELTAAVANTTPFTTN